VKRYNSGQGSNHLRLAILATLIIIFIALATNMIWKLRIAAERAGVIHTVGSLQSAVGIKLSERIIREGIGALAILHQSNPMQLWNPPPSNYRGAFSRNEAPLEQGVWYFNTDDKLLIYRVRFTDYFISANPQYPDLARYQLQVNYRDINNNQQFDPDIDDANGLFLQPVDNYTWLHDTN
jgi:hypothetical protein